jgi:hypothetical protein
MVILVIILVNIIHEPKIQKLFKMYHKYSMKISYFLYYNLFT